MMCNISGDSDSSSDEDDGKNDEELAIFTDITDAIVVGDNEVLVKHSDSSKEYREVFSQLSIKNDYRVLKVESF